MERLTEKCYCGYDVTNRESDTDYNDKEIFKVLQKLGQLEDIVEKYNIESIEELEKTSKEIDELKNKLTTIEKETREKICDEIRFRALLLEDNCPDHNIEIMYGVRKCLLDKISKGE